MVSKKAKGKRAKGRDKTKRRRPKATPNKRLRIFRKGVRVTLKIDSSVHSGMPSLRYHGMTATVMGKRGSVFMVELTDGGLSKYLLVHPAHMWSVKEIKKAGEAGGRISIAGDLKGVVK